MFKKPNMYFILVVSAFELLLGLFLVKPEGKVIAGMLIAWLFFVMNLLNAFNLDEDVFIIRIYALKGINNDRKLGLLLISFGLIVLPGALFFAWMSKF